MTHNQDLINMLCIIHRDGGHYISDHGMQKAYDDACEKLHRWKQVDDVPNMTGVRVRKIGGSFQHTGTVVSVFTTTAGETRIVLEFDAPIQGMLHIYRPDQVEFL